MSPPLSFDEDDFSLELPVLAFARAGVALAGDAGVDAGLLGM